MAVPEQVEAWRLWTPSSAVFEGSFILMEDRTILPKALPSKGGEAAPGIRGDMEAAFSLAARSMSSERH